MASSMVMVVHLNVETVWPPNWTGADAFDTLGRVVLDAFETIGRGDVVLRKFPFWGVEMCLHLS